MYKTDVTITCSICGKTKQLLKAEYDRHLRNGRHDFYCSRSCSSKHVYTLGHLNHSPQTSVPANEHVLPLTPSAADERARSMDKIVAAQDEYGDYQSLDWIRTQIVKLHPELTKLPLNAALLIKWRERLKVS